MPRKAAPKAVEIERSHTPIIIASIVMLGFIVTGGIVYWGSHESGQINVNEKIAHSQSAQVSEGGTVSPVGMVLDEHRTLPNGGLQAQGGEVAAPPQPEVVPTDTATSTATSTDAGTDTTEAPTEGGVTDESGSGSGTPEAPPTEPEVTQDTPAETSPEQAGGV